MPIIKCIFKYKSPPLFPGDSNCKPNALSYNPAENSVIVSTYISSKSGSGTTYYEVYQIPAGNSSELTSGEGG